MCHLSCRHLSLQTRLKCANNTGKAPCIDLTDYGIFKVRFRESEGSHKSEGRAL